MDRVIDDAKYELPFNDAVTFGLDDIVLFIVTS